MTRPAASPPVDELVTAAQAAKLLGLSERTVWRMAAEKRLRVYRPRPRSPRFSTAELLAARNAGAPKAEDNHAIARRLLR